VWRTEKFLKLDWKVKVYVSLLSWCQFLCPCFSLYGMCERLVLMTKLVCIFFIEVSTPRFILFFSSNYEKLFNKLMVAYVQHDNNKFVNRNGWTKEAVRLTLINTISKLSDTLACDTHVYLNCFHFKIISNHNNNYHSSTRRLHIVSEDKLWRLQRAYVP
jgi:hypothetical protein